MIPKVGEIWQCRSQIYRARITGFNGVLLSGEILHDGSRHTGWQWNVSNVKDGVFYYRRPDREDVFDMMQKLWPAE